MKNREFITIKSCARCGKDHEHLEFRKFKNPIEDSDGTIWNYWGLCSITEEPILLKIKEKQTNE